MQHFHLAGPEEFYLRFVPHMHGRFSQLALDAKNTRDAYLMMQEGEGDNVAGYAKLSYMDVSGAPSTRVDYVEIANDRRRQGYGPILCHQVFAHAAERGRFICLTPYTPMGRAYLMDREQEFLARFPQLEVFHIQYA